MIDIVFEFAALLMTDFPMAACPSSNLHGGEANLLANETAEIVVVGNADGSGDVRDGQTRRLQHLSCLSDFQVQLVLVRGHARRLHKMPQQRCLGGVRNPA